VEKTLAPWNVRHFAEQSRARLDPVFYHFHGLRLLPDRRARLFKFFDVGAAGVAIYGEYLAALSQSYAHLKSRGIQTPAQALPSERFGWLKALGRRLKKTERFAKIPMVPVVRSPQEPSAISTAQARNQPAQR
jgi:hypothetical protein